MHRWIVVVLRSTEFFSCNKVNYDPPYLYKVGFLFEEEFKMKKLLAVLLALAMVFSFAACGEKQNEAKDSPDGLFKIGVMQFGEFTALQNAFEGFKQGLKDAGWVEGRIK